MNDCKNCKYTDEYCASGECTSQSPRNGSQNGDLTSQWKKGELPSGEYYIKTKGNEEAIIEKYFNRFQSFDWHYDKNIEQVLAPVPSYDEYLESESHCAVYSELNKYLKEENAQLKELLKECKEPLEVFADKKDACEWYPEDLLAKIDEVLK